MAKKRVLVPALLSAALLLGGLVAAAPASAGGNARTAHRCVDRVAPGRPRGECVRLGAQATPAVTLGQCIALETGGWSLPISWSGYIGNDPETPLSFQVYDGNGDLFLDVPDMTDYTIDGAGNLELGLGTFDGETWTPPTGTWTFVFSDDIDGTANAVLNADAACPPA